MNKLSSLRNLVLFAFVCGLLFLAGCGKDDDPVAAKCLLSKITDDDDETTLTYNADGKLTSFTETYIDKNSVKVSITSTITYDSKGNVTKVQYGSNYSDTYTYNAGNQLTKEESFEGTELDSKLEYEYNTTGQLVKIKYYYSSGSGGLEFSTYRTFEYSSTSSKNPTKSKTYLASGTLEGTNEYEYDDKKTINSIVGLSLSGEVAFEENNVKKDIQKDETGAVVSTTTYTYEYNDKGFPVKMTYTLVYGGQTQKNQVTTYTYECK